MHLEVLDKFDPNRPTGRLTYLPTTRLEFSKVFKMSWVTDVSISKKICVGIIENH